MRKPSRTILSFSEDIPQARGFRKIEAGEEKNTNESNVRSVTTFLPPTACSQRAREAFLNRYKENYFLKSKRRRKRFVEQRQNDRVRIGAGFMQAIPTLILNDFFLFFTSQLGMTLRDYYFAFGFASSKGMLTTSNCQY